MFLLSFLACLDRSLSPADRNRTFDFLKQQGVLENPSQKFDELLATGDIYGDSTLRPALKFPAILLLQEQRKLDATRQLIDQLFPVGDAWHLLLPLEKERDMRLVFLCGDMTKGRNLLKIYTREHRLDTELILWKAFGRYLSIELLNALPLEVSSILIRVDLKENLFNPLTSPSIEWGLQNAVKLKGEELLLVKMLAGHSLEDIDSTSARAVKAWQEKDFNKVCTILDPLERLIKSNKIRAGKYNYYLVMIHVLSRCLHVDAESGSKLLSTYRDFMKAKLILRVLDIFIDLQKAAFHRAKKKLAALKPHLDGTQGDIFWLNLAYFWCNDKLSPLDIESLQRIKLYFAEGDNELMRFELDVLLKEALGAGDLLSSLENFSHHPLARMKRADNRWKELLEKFNTPQVTVELKKRLIWLIQLEPGDDNNAGWCEIEPALQEQAKNGIWKKPDYISWAYLLKARNRQYLSSYDKRVLRLLRSAKDSHGLDYMLPEGGALKALSGADNIFLCEDYQQAVLLEYQPPTVELRTRHSQKVFSWKYPLSQGAVHVEEVEDFIYEVCALTPQMEDLRQRSLQAIPLFTDEENVQSFIDSLPKEIVVESDALDFKNGVERRHTFSTIARFVPSGSEYRLELLVSSSGLTATPANGSRVISANTPEGQIVWERDRAAEKTYMNKLCEKLQLDPEDCLSPYEWDMLDPIELLEVLDRLQDHSQVELQWPRGGKVKVKKATGGSFTVKSSERRDWFKLDGKVVFGKNSIRLADLIKAMNKDSRFVALSDDQYLALSAELRQGLSDIAALSEQNHEYLELHAALSDTLKDKLQGLPLDVEEDFIFRDCVTRMLYNCYEKTVVPAGLKATLRDYQQQGFEWLVRLCDKGVGACLADDMGLGKTLQSIALLLHKQSVGPSIIIAPTSLGHNWIDEGRKFAPEMNFIDYRGDNRQSLLHGLKAGDVIVCSYALLLQDIDYLGESLWNIMILDEAQMVKNSATQRSRALKIIQARSYVALSGTPVENHVGELWNLFDIINPGLLGKRSHFQKNYALPIEKHDQAALQQLREKVKPFILRRLRKDVLKELPESQELTVYLEMNNDEKDVYNACRYQVAKTLKNPYDRERRKKNKIQILAEITRLRKLAANFELSEAFTGRSTKSAALMEKLIELMENEHRVLIFSQFVSHLDLVASYLDEEEISFSRIDGRMNPLQRKNAVQLFESHQREVMLISLKAGGFGLNLTAADFVIHLDPWWNPAAEDQASGRALRIGQTKNVTILRFIMRDSIEEDILKMHEHKREISDDILKGTKAASRMTTDDLLKLLGK